MFYGYDINGRLIRKTSERLCQTCGRQQEMTLSDGTVFGSSCNCYDEAIISKIKNQVTDFSKLDLKKLNGAKITIYGEGISERARLIKCETRADW